MKRYVFDPQIQAWRLAPSRAQVALDRFGHLAEMLAGYVLVAVAMAGLVALVTG